MPALLKAFLEQALQPGFATAKPEEAGRMWKKLLTGKTARIVVTMGMPVFIYRWYFRAHGLIEASDNTAREKWLVKMRALGGEGR
jgi:putative NADPH-quinone reductase